ncbi:ORMDL family protein [Tritrichomonas foetus]|uniref:ORMDL family protein n=1 Tax=Tritrichomonas foetus TaxID=1144522 RepID=A0A1J4JB54_9EUKA|nr:ORMDL family protein [Tritrichomonas foetus]|eukprot:OHS96392.1 ORMDL family protein [Tritrichomonas foetus]
MHRSSSVPSLNVNVEFIDNPVCWVFIVMLFLIQRVVLAGIGLSARTAWTIVNYTHGIISYVTFHFPTGDPFLGDNCRDHLTFWEQIDDQMQFTQARKFLTILPIVFFLIAVDAAEWEPKWFWSNFVICFIIVVAKLPFLHQVRIFGIGS